MVLESLSSDLECLYLRSEISISLYSLYEICLCLGSNTDRIDSGTHCFI